MKLSRGKRLIILGVLLVVVDQVVKYLVKTNMTLGQQIPVLGQWFRICFIENEGMAFGMKFGGVAGKYFLSVFRICLCVALVWWISSLNKKGKAPVGVLVGLTLITAGAFGNIIDSMFYGLIFSESTTSTLAVLGGSYAPFLQGKVVDMLYFPIIRSGERVIFFSPVFNIADSCVTVGAFYLILFQWKFFSKESR